MLFHGWYFSAVCCHLSSLRWSFRPDKGWRRGIVRWIRCCAFVGRSFLLNATFMVWPWMSNGMMSWLDIRYPLVWPSLTVQLFSETSELPALCNLFEPCWAWRVNFRAFVFRCFRHHFHYKTTDKYSSIERLKLSNNEGLAPFRFVFPSQFQDKWPKFLQNNDCEAGYLIVFINSRCSFWETDFSQES